MNNARRKQIEKAMDLLEKIKDDFAEAFAIIEQVSDEERESYDNMPESLQSSDRGYQSEAACDALEEVKGNMEGLDLDDAISTLERARE